MFEIIDSHVSVDVADLEETRRYLEEACGLTKFREVNRPGLTIAWYPAWSCGRRPMTPRPAL